MKVTGRKVLFAVMLIAWLAVVVTLLSDLARAQTTINGGRTITSAVTIQGATTLTGTTKTINFEAALPGTCTAPSGSTPGECVFRTSDNTLHCCTATDTFTQIGGGGGGGCQITEDTYANQPATCAECDTFFPTDNRILEAYCPTTNTWKYKALGQRITLPTGTWSFVNQASSTQSQATGTLRFVTPKSGTVSISALCRTPDTSIVGTFDFTLLNDMSGRPPGSSGTATEHGVAVGFYESATGKFVTLRTTVNASGLGLVTDKWTNSSSFSAAYLSYQTTTQGVDQIQYNPLVFRIENDNTNLKFYWSANRGNDFELFDTQAKADFFTTAPDQICVIHYANGDRIVSELIHYVGN